MTAKPETLFLILHFQTNLRALYFVEKFGNGAELADDCLVKLLTNDPKLKEKAESWHQVINGVRFG